MPTISTPPTTVIAICTNPSRARLRPWALRSGANTSRARTGRPASASRTTCIRPPSRIGTRNITSRVSGIATAITSRRSGAWPAVALPAPTITASTSAISIAAAYKARISNIAAPNTARGFLPPKSMACLNQARPWATGNARMSMGVLGGEALRIPERGRVALHAQRNGAGSCVHAVRHGPPRPGACRSAARAPARHGGRGCSRAYARH